MNRHPAVVTGFTICVLLGVLDVAATAGAGTAAAPPMAVIVTGLVLGLITLGAAVPAWRGNRAALWTVAGSRAVAGLLGFGVYTDDAAPAWAVVVTTAAIVATVAGLALLAPALRGSRRAALA